MMRLTFGETLELLRNFPPSLRSTLIAGRLRPSVTLIAARITLQPSSTPWGEKTPVDAHRLLSAGSFRSVMKWSHD